MRRTKKAFPLWWEGLFAGKFFARKIFCKQKGKLLGAEDAFAAFAKTRNDEFLVVALFIQGSAVTLYVRIRFG